MDFIYNYYQPIFTSKQQYGSFHMTVTVNTERQPIELKQL